MAELNNAAASGFTITYVDVVVKNSVLVLNPASATHALSLGCHGGGHVVDGGGNQCWSSRQAAFGAGHDFPYLPALLTQNPSGPGDLPCPTS